MDHKAFKIYFIVLATLILARSTANASVLIEHPSDSIIIENSLDHLFSNPLAEDTFTVRIIGNSLIEGEVVFTITSQLGVEIYSVRFPSINLLGYNFSLDDGTRNEKEAYIKQKIFNFFSEDNFIYPAIKKDEVFDQDYSNKKIWDDIKTDNQSIGFYYQVSGGYYRKIAYSKMKNQTVVYFECC